MHRDSPEQGIRCHSATYEYVYVQSPRLQRDQPTTHVVRIPGSSWIQSLSRWLLYRSTAPTLSGLSCLGSCDAHYDPSSPPSSGYWSQRSRSSRARLARWLKSPARFPDTRAGDQRVTNLAIAVRFRPRICPRICIMNPGAKRAISASSLRIAFLLLSAP